MFRALAPDREPGFWPILPFAVALLFVVPDALEAQMVEQTLLPPPEAPSRDLEAEFATALDRFLGEFQLPFVPFTLPRGGDSWPDRPRPPANPDLAFRIVLVHALTLEGESKRFEKELADLETGEDFRKALEAAFEEGLETADEMLRDSCREFLGRRGAGTLHVRVLCSSALLEARLARASADGFGYPDRMLAIEFGEATRDEFLAGLDPETPQGAEDSIPVSALWVYAHGGAEVTPAGVDTSFWLEGGAVRPADLERTEGPSEIECVVLHCCDLGQDRSSWERVFPGRLRTWSASPSWSVVLADQKHWRCSDPGDNLSVEGR